MTDQGAPVRTSRYQKLFSQIAADIDAGRLEPGTRLPLLRAQAQAQGVSRNTVEAAYMLLVQEGYAESRPASGFYVMARG